MAAEIPKSEDPMKDLNPAREQKEYGVEGAKTDTEKLQKLYGQVESNLEDTENIIKEFNATLEGIDVSVDLSDPASIEAIADRNLQEKLILLRQTLTKIEEYKGELENVKTAIETHQTIGGDATKFFDWCKSHLDGMGNIDGLLKTLGSIKANEEKAFQKAIADVDAGIKEIEAYLEKPKSLLESITHDNLDRKLDNAITVFKEYENEVSTYNDLELPDTAEGKVAAKIRLAYSNLVYSVKTLIENKNGDKGVTTITFNFDNPTVDGGHGRKKIVIDEETLDDHLIQGLKLIPQFKAQLDAQLTKAGIALPASLSSEEKAVAKPAETPEGSLEIAGTKYPVSVEKSEIGNMSGSSTEITKGYIRLRDKDGKAIFLPEGTDINSLDPKSLMKMFGDKFNKLASGFSKVEISKVSFEKGGKRDTLILSFKKLPEVVEKEAEEEKSLLKAGDVVLKPGAETVTPHTYEIFKEADFNGMWKKNVEFAANTADASLGVKPGQVINGKLTQNQIDAATPILNANKEVIGCSYKDAEGNIKTAYLRQAPHGVEYKYPITEGSYDKLGTVTKEIAAKLILGSSATEENITNYVANNNIYISPLSDPTDGSKKYMHIKVIPKNVASTTGTSAESSPATSTDTDTGSAETGTSSTPEAVSESILAANKRLYESLKPAGITKANVKNSDLAFKGGTLVLNIDGYNKDLLKDASRLNIPNDVKLNIWKKLFPSTQRRLGLSSQYDAKKLTLSISKDGKSVSIYKGESVTDRYPNQPRATAGETTKKIDVTNRVKNLVNKAKGQLKELQDISWFSGYGQKYTNKVKNALNATLETLREAARTDPYNAEVYKLMYQAYDAGLSKFIIQDLGSSGFGAEWRKQRETYKRMALNLDPNIMNKSDYADQQRRRSEYRGGPGNY